ncbi:MAG: hypothetical protein H0T56_14585 [Pseudaminobacter sp.]|nr:hypothetical protein [Pseudaminobacter sp.]
MPDNAVPEPLDDETAWLLEAIDRIEREQAGRQKRRENPWALYLIKVLWPYPNGLARRTAIDRIWAARREANLPMPTEFDRTVQSIFNGHNSQSPEFRRRGTPPEGDLFYPVGGKGSGKWAVYHDKAKEWVLSRGLPEA